MIKECTRKKKAKIPEFDETDLRAFLVAGSLFFFPSKKKRHTYNKKRRTAMASKMHGVPFHYGVSESQSFL